MHMIEEDFLVYRMKDDENQFIGACLDTGASVSLILRLQAEECSKKMGISLPIELTPKKTFKFDSQTKQRIRKTRIAETNCDECIMQLDLDFLEVKVPLLIGLGILDKHKLYVKNVENLLVCVAETECHTDKKAGEHIFMTGITTNFILNENSSAYTDISTIHVQIECLI